MKNAKLDLLKEIKGEKIRVVVYARVSTKNEEQDSSIEMQGTVAGDFLDNYSESYGLEIVKFIQERQSAAKRVKIRKEMQEILAMSDRHEFDLLICKDVSRFSRNSLDFYVMLDRLKNNGVYVYFLSGNFCNVDTNDDRNVLSFQSIIATNESLYKSDSVKIALNQNKKRGSVPSRVYGYKRVGMDKLEIVEEQAEAVRKCFSLYKAGYSMQEIAKELNSAGYKTYEQKDFYAETVSYILNNELYTGKVINNKTRQDDLNSERYSLDESDYIITHNEAFRIVSDEDFYAVKAKLDTLKGKKNPHAMKKFLTGKIYCAECGCVYNRSKEGRKNEGQYRTVFRHSKPCPNGNKVTLREQDMFEILKGLFRQYIEQDKRLFVEVLEMAKYKIIESMISDSTHEREEELKKLKGRLNRKRKMFEDGLFDDEEQEIQEMKEMKAEIKGLESELSHGVRLTEKDILDYLKNNLKTAEDYVNCLNLQDLDIYEINNIIEKIVVNKDSQVDVILKGSSEADSSSFCSCSCKNEERSADRNTNKRKGCLTVRIDCEALKNDYLKNRSCDRITRRYAERLRNGFFRLYYLI